MTPPLSASIRNTLRTSVARSLFTPSRGGGRGRLRRDHAGFQRCGRHPDAVHIPLLRDWLRRDIGFEGVIIADYSAIAERLRHGVAGDPAEAAAAALIAGVELI